MRDLTADSALLGIQTGRRNSQPFWNGTRSKLTGLIQGRAYLRRPSLYVDPWSPRDVKCRGLWKKDLGDWGIDTSCGAIDAVCTESWLRAQCAAPHLCTSTERGARRRAGGSFSPAAERQRAS